MLSRLAFAAVIVALPVPVAAAVTANKNCKEPIEVEANNASADLQANTLSYDGDVVVKQCDIRIRGDRIKVTTIAGGKEANTVEVTGNVVASSPTTGSATGDNGIYDVRNNTVDLTGRRVVLTNGNGTSMVGTHLAVNMTTGVAKILSAGSRVRAVFPARPTTTERR